MEHLVSPWSGVEFATFGRNDTSRSGTSRSGTSRSGTNESAATATALSRPCFLLVRRAQRPSAQMSKINNLRVR